MIEFSNFEKIFKKFDFCKSYKRLSGKPVEPPGTTLLSEIIAYF